MAIVNRTTHSFFDMGATFALDAAVEAGERAVADGADWLDIGGVPFLNGPDVTEADELDRVIPLIAELRGRTDAVISIDTFRPGVARRALDAGADVINDTSGLRDPAMAQLAAATGATLIVTHSLAPPRTKWPRPTYGDVVAEVASFLEGRVAAAKALGVAEEQIVVDPGHDLNKNTFHSLELTRRLEEIAALGHVLLVAVSNKDFIGEVTDRPVTERLGGTLAATVLSIVAGARIVRVHDVPAAVSAVRTTEAVLGWRQPRAPVHNMT
ncbi:MAG: dihydropteroate synthase [Acidimicrobiales bacterium]